MATNLRDVVRGYIGGGWGKDAPDAQHYKEAFVIRGTDFDAVTRRDTSGVPYRFHKQSNAKSRVLEEGDIVFEVSGGSKDQPVGRSLLITGERLRSFSAPVIPASFCKRISPNKDLVSPRFLHAHLQLAWLDRRIVQWQVQSTGISNFKFEEFLSQFEMDLPPLPVQRWVAGMLSAYDELIENSQRRIRILEAMASALYREWFVHLRFPGHEKSVASPLGDIPQGWEGSFGDLATIDRDGINPFEFPGEQFEHFSIPAFDEGRQPAIESGETILSGKYCIDGSCVLLSKLNPRIPRIWLPVPSGERRAITSTEFLVLKPKTGVAREFIYAKCCSDEFAAQFGSLAIGTSTSHQRVRPENLLIMPCTVPDRKTIASFAGVVSPMLSLSQQLRSQVPILRRTRDLLLPRLLSGQIEVETS